MKPILNAVKDEDKKGLNIDDSSPCKQKDRIQYDDDDCWILLV